MLELNLHTLIGFIGLILLMITVVIEKESRRKWWFASAVFLVIYNLSRKDWINTAVNTWVLGVNFCYLVIWKKRRK